jgi:hypothetical protein
MSDAATLDDSVSCFTLPFPGVDEERPARSAPRRRTTSSQKPAATAARPTSGDADWFAARLPQHGPRLDDHLFQFPAPERGDVAWDWRWSASDVWSFLLLRDENGSARDPGAAQILSWFQSVDIEALDPAERLWSLRDYLYRFEPGRRWQALIGDLDSPGRRLSVAWIGSFEGLVWNEARTLRAIVPTPGSLADEAMPDPMTLRLDWTGRVALGVGPAREDLAAFRREEPTPLPLQVHRTTDRR